MLHVLFGFNGYIARSTFFLGIIVQCIFLYCFNWAFHYAYGTFIFGHLVDINRLMQELQTLATSKKAVTIPLSDINNLSLAILLPILIPFAISLWITLALYIKRYRDMNVSWPVTLFLLISPFLAIIAVALAMPLIAGLNVYLLWTITRAVMLYPLFIYLLVPLFCTSRNERY